jgi:hypothetical protein
MDRDLKRDLVIAWEALLPPDVRKRPATEAELLAFESEFGPIPAEFRWFLSVLGGGPVGSEHVDDIAALRETHRKFAREFGPPRGWTLRNVFVIGWDGAGNPFGIASSGEILGEDHNVGSIFTMSPSFERFLVSGILERH